MKVNGANFVRFKSIYIHFSFKTWASFAVQIIFVVILGFMVLRCHGDKVVKLDVTL